MPFMPLHPGENSQVFSPKMKMCGGACRTVCSTARTKLGLFICSSALLLSSTFVLSANAEDASSRQQENSSATVSFLKKGKVRASRRKSTTTSTASRGRTSSRKAESGTEQAQQQRNGKTRRKKLDVEETTNVHTYSRFYPYLDSLNPTAPMDEVGDPVVPSTISGMWMNSQVFPPYLLPETFPNEPSDEPGADESNKKDVLYYHKKPHRVKYGKGGHQILDYAVKPADGTWPNGDVLFPKVDNKAVVPDATTRSSRSGVHETVIAGPAERIPWDQLPIVAPGERGVIENWQNTVGKLDYIPKPVARYLDQVHDAGFSCENDTRDPRCVTPDCPLNAVDDGLALVIGNLKVDRVEMLEKTADDLFKVRITGLHDEGKDCSELGCTILRQCYHEATGPYEAAGCTEMQYEHKYDAFRNLETPKGQCPSYHEVCSTVVQQVPKGTLFFNGKACV
ncbi:unnamed protein product [Amoebophrya sp. A120]|nr:unnamed protein product [Amoebophrya sp. A120]|eukprot:GSA120T00016649001.1